MHESKSRRSTGSARNHKKKLDGLNQTEIFELCENSAMIAMPFQKSGAFIAVAGEIWSIRGVLQHSRRPIARLLQSMALSLRRIHCRVPRSRLRVQQAKTRGEDLAQQPTRGASVQRHSTALATKTARETSRAWAIKAASQNFPNRYREHLEGAKMVYAISFISILNTTRFNNTGVRDDDVYVACSQERNEVTYPSCGTDAALCGNWSCRVVERIMVPRSNDECIAGVGKGAGQSVRYPA